jgi:hypothetical protein
MLELYIQCLLGNRLLIRYVILQAKLPATDNELFCNTELNPNEPTATRNFVIRTCLFNCFKLIEY